MIDAPGSVAIGDRSLEVPAEPFRLASPASPGEVPAPLTDPEIEVSLDRPVGSPGLEEEMRGAGRVLIVVSDATRKTGAERYLPPMLERIRRAGVKEIAFAVASGLHRKPDPADVARILGEDLASRYRVHLHDPEDEAGLVELGRTRAGTRVRVHEAVMRYDRLVLTGAAGFHYYAGFSGGRKAVVPGLAARETIVGNHLRAVRRDGTRHPRARAGRLDGNPVHRDMVEGAALAKPSFLVNAVMRQGGGIERLFAGHWRRAHERAGRYLRRTRSVRVKPRDLVVVSAGGDPYDVDLIQAHKAFEAVFRAVRPGGVVVLVASCARGAGHPDFLPAFDVPTTGELVRILMDDYRVYRQTALAWRRKADSCRLVMVSDLDRSTVRSLGAEPAADLGEAFAHARSGLSPGEEGWLFPLGARWLIDVPEETA